MNLKEHEFLKALDKKLWTAADKLRTTVAAADYKHIVLGLIFLKYVSDAFGIRHKELEEQLKDKNHEYFLDPSNFANDDEYQNELETELEIRDYYTEKNVFWVPEPARWESIKNCAKLPSGSELPWGVKMRSTAHLIDDALESIEKDNPKLKGILNKTYVQFRLEDSKIGELIDHISSIPFVFETLRSKDILGHVYEYFLGQFASAEGKKGGQFYTPKSIVTLIIEMLQPFNGRVYDPAMGSGGFFVQSEKFIEDHKGKINNIAIYGQEYNRTTWQLASMNMVIRGLDFNFGKQPANTFLNDQHPDLRADYVMANPPFNMKEWWDGRLEGDPRWRYGTPSKGNANFAWMQHMIYHLASNGSMALLLANGSMSSNTGGEGDIRKSLIENDLVECMVALPGQLFTNTQIPACIWFLTKNKKERNGYRDRSKEILFIDAREKGYMKDRVLRDFSVEDVLEIANTYLNWKKGEGYEDIKGFCKSVTFEEIEKHDFVLTPGRYVGIKDEEDDGEPFEDKMKRLTAALSGQFKESTKLEAEIKKNLAGLGYEI